MFVIKICEQGNLKKRIFHFHANDEIIELIENNIDADGNKCDQIFYDQTIFSDQNVNFVNRQMLGQKSSYLNACKDWTICEVCDYNFETREI